jgi:hypothetical protein
MSLSWKRERRSVEIWRFVVGRDESCTVPNKVESKQETNGCPLVTGHPCIRFFE